ncbi:xanthine dehydrogenase family protein molybdopterin-binding subunit [Hyphococcus sp.]|uniref:xanthine dehydrogenase family protein molybdopterin-binding subunit n=1 Tax=Hyphococcus sp. TaxID=2038636 RepID=UPI003CCB74B3
MTKTFTMDAPVEECILDDVPDQLTGAAFDRPDGPRKVSGAATYAHEWNLPGTAYGVLVRSTISVGAVKSLNEDAAQTFSGVLGIYADDRFLRNPAQGMANEAPVQKAQQIAYYGQPIALVVAESFEAARHAAQSLEVEYDAEEDGVFDPEGKGVEHEEPEDQQTEQGDFDKAMREAAFTVDAVYRTPCHNSAPMEPHCSIASWDGDRLTLRGAYQMLKYNRNEIADALKIEPENVRILAPFVGGGFGSKLGIAPEAVAAAIAAKDLDRPVVVAMARQQVFDMVMRRSESRQRLRLAADKDGRLTGFGHEALVSNLPDEEFLEPVLQASHFVYGGENRKLSLKAARVNRTCAGSVRAPGEAIGMQALENAMDELAEAAQIDPVELRLRNIPECDPEEDKPFSSRRFVEALKEGAKQFGWDRRNPKPGAVRDGEWLIGMGMAGAARVNMLIESEARVTLNSDATAVIETDMTDIGTGTYAILTQIAADMLGLPPEDVECRLGDTEFPPACGSGGSFGASSAGSSVYLACQHLREKLAERFGCDASELTLEKGGATVGNNTQTLQKLLSGESLSALGHIKPGDTSDDVRQATYGSYFAEVAVSAVTGETRVRRMLGVFGAGRILNEKTATSQCYGAMIWGIGMALTEELVHDFRDGRIVNRDLAEYHLPVNLDAPQIEVTLLPERDPWASPIQSKGIGELGICGAAAAVTNAIYNATGVRVREYPATLDKVIAGFDSRDT